MKRIIPIILAIILLGLTASTALAEKPGENATVTITLRGSNAYSVGINLNYDKNVLEYVSASSSGGHSVIGSAGKFSAFSMTDDALPNGALGTIKFKIKEGAASGTYDIKVSVDAASDSNGNSISVSVSAGSVTVVGNDPTPTVKPTAAPTVKPTATPTAKPTAAPTAKPTATPTVKPTATPTATAAPTVKPTTAPTATAAPTAKPTAAPTATATPTAKPTTAPTAAPTTAPTAAPTAAPSAAPTPQATTKPEDKPASDKNAEWRSNQTVSSMGIRYRDIKPGLTSKWYMFTPLDLTQDGVTELDLVAANASIIGTVTVTVQDGEVKVGYKLRGGVEVRSMGFAILPDLASVTDVDAIDCTRFAFDQDISIEDDLDGESLVLLQVMGRVDYNFNDYRYTRFHSDGKAYHELVDSLLPIVE